LGQSVSLTEIVEQSDEEEKDVEHNKVQAEEVKEE